LGKFEESMEYYERTLKSNPDMGWAYRDRSYLHRADAQYELAIQDYDKCLEMDPEIPSETAQFYGYRGLLQAYVEKKSEMEYDLNMSIKLDPSFSFSHIALSSHYAEINKPHKVMQVLDDAISNCHSFSAGDMHRLLTARHDYLSYYTAGNFPGFAGQGDRVKQYKREMLLCGANERVA
jgi:tetratricopeptide (TPR) repeat protein